MVTVMRGEGLEEVAKKKKKKRMFPGLFLKH